MQSTAGIEGERVERGDGPDVVTIGETLACLVAPDGRLDAARFLTKAIGGSESNTAVGLARLGDRATWLSRVGNDPFGDEILRTLRGEGVDVSRVRRARTATTGLMVRERRTVDEIHVHYYRDHSAASEIEADDVPEQLIATARRVHLTGITLGLGPGPRAAVHKMIDLAKANSVPVSFDPNIRRKLWTESEAVGAIAEVLPYVSDLLANEDEALALTGAVDIHDALAALERHGIPNVIVKRGAAGAVARVDGRGLEVPAVAGPVLDTVGAGDAFNAGYLHACLAGDPTEVAVRVGAWVASRVVAHHGDYEGLPTADELATWRRDAPVVTR